MGADRTDGEIRVRVDGAVGHLILSRPGKHNACTLAMWTAIPERLAELAAVPGVALISIEGDGREFCAGADLSDVLAATEGPDIAQRDCARITDALLAIAHSPVPTVAAVGGAAAGGGCEIALAADLRYLDESASFLLPLARLGVVPDRLTLRRLTQLAGPGTARSLLLRGTRLNASASLRARLADEVFTEAGLPVAVDELGATLHRNSPYATRGIKQALLIEEGLDQLPGVADRMARSMAEGDVAASATGFLARER